MKTNQTNYSCFSGITSAVLVVLTALLMVPMARTEVIVKTVAVPGSLAEVEGNSFLFEPFSPGRAEANSVRVQQVYAASEFLLSDAPLGGWIHGLSFRADRANVDQIYSALIPNLQIHLSVTDRGPDELSPVFAENVGSSAALVISGRNSVSVSAHGVDPEPWSLFFTFSRPYFYDPSRGNLLLDVINIGGGPLAALDAVHLAGDGVSSAISNEIGTQIPTSGNVDTIGLVTRFTMVPVPEPSIWAILGVAMTAFGLRNWHLTSRRRSHHVAH